tara:strand:+ start:908 stop:1162 length:255 start_codon:yes stop_codon:yes gene_type:complete
MPKRPKGPTGSIKMEKMMKFEKFPTLKTPPPLKIAPNPVGRSYSGTTTFGGVTMTHPQGKSQPKSAARRKMQTKKAIRKAKRRR